MCLPTDNGSAETIGGHATLTPVKQDKQTFTWISTSGHEKVVGSMTSVVKKKDSLPTDSMKKKTLAESNLMFIKTRVITVPVLITGTDTGRYGRY